ncbi:Nop12p [Sugiyamaella lignohabitans]|uniref:Nucleolar protein 12 n=1 Tax=Sugiyamaella lignohabitans TaxID=796027 RepID=A0A167FWK3_9ASCO|nr:Nop12p [Sugiyamaella lignohabitans]ANB15792.1 Nop12p [Sugiyamaella lignohabitans]
MSKSSLFGSVKQSELDSNVASLFGSSAGPLQKPKRLGSQPVEVDEETGSNSDSSVDDGEPVLDNLDDESDDEILQVLRQVKGPSSKKRKHDEDDDGDLESEYMSKILEEDKKTDEKKRLETKGEDLETDEDESDQELEKNQNQKEETEVEDEKTKTDSRASTTKLSVDTILDQLPTTELGKAESTLFVGNLSSSVITNKPNYKQFKALFSKYGKVESIRFRSIAFSEMLPRKAAFIKHKLHDTRDTVNSYVVYKNKQDAKLGLELNGKVFLDHHLRVDSVSHPAKQDNKRSVFIGNLDFEAAEEPLWNHFKDCGDIEYVRLIRDSKTNVGKGFGYVQFKDTNAVSKALLLDGKKVQGAKGRNLRISRAKNIRPSTRPAARAERPSAKRPKLTNADRTKVGRAMSVLGKAGRAHVTDVVEGTRAKPGDAVPGLKLGSGGKRKNKPRIRARSTNFKKGLHKAGKPNGNDNNK